MAPASVSIACAKMPKTNKVSSNGDGKYLPDGGCSDKEELPWLLRIFSLPTSSLSSATMSGMMAVMSASACSSNLEDV